MSASVVAAAFIAGVVFTGYNIGAEEKVLAELGKCYAEEPRPCLYQAETIKEKLEREALPESVTINGIYHPERRRKRELPLYVPQWVPSDEPTEHRDEHYGYWIKLQL